MSLNHTHPKFDTVIIRFAGEIGIKAAWTRKLYERHLVNNIKAVLKHNRIHYESINRTFGRIYLKTEEVQSISIGVINVFGISSISPAIETTSKMGDIIDVCVRVAESKFRKNGSFAVRCRRVGEHQYTSQEVCRQVGRQILNAFPQLSLRVNLGHPECTMGVEIRDNRTFIFTESIKGTGGLPLGTQPKLVCLLTDDINSAVACWLTMRRGCPPVLVHFDDSPSINNDQLDAVLTHAQTLSEWSIGFPKRLKIIPNSKNLAETIAKYPKELTSLINRRFMFRLAERIAESENAEGIVTGETIGNNPTLTLHNFRMEDEASKKYPVYRPLQGFEPSETADFAGRIGIKNTPRIRVNELEFSSQSLDQVKTLKLSNIRNLEKKINFDGMVDASMNSAFVKDL